MKQLLMTFLITIAGFWPTVGFSSTVEDLVLLCRGNMELDQVISLSNSIEQNILNHVKENKIIQREAIGLIKDGVTTSAVKTGAREYQLCIDRMAPQVMSNKTEISGKIISIINSHAKGLVKTPIQISKSNKTRIVFQYAREEQGQYVIALRLINNFNGRDHKFYFKKKSAQLVGEDSGEEYKLESINGLGSTSQPSATVPAMGSKLIKFYFKIPSQQEPLTFSNAWGSAGEAGNLGMAITFTPYPMNISWLEVKAVNYQYSGLAQKQGID